MEKKVLFIIFSIVIISISPQVFSNDELDALLAEKNAVLIEQQQIVFEVGTIWSIFKGAPSPHLQLPEQRQA